jgi:hypothetical protein
VWRGDGHYGRVEAMDWADEHDNIDYIFGNLHQRIVPKIVVAAGRSNGSSGSSVMVAVAQG